MTRNNLSQDPSELHFTNENNIVHHIKSKGQDYRYVIQWRSTYLACIRPWIQPLVVSTKQTKIIKDDNTTIK